MTGVLSPFTFSVVCMTTDALSSSTVALRLNSVRTGAQPRRLLNFGIT